MDSLEEKVAIVTGGGSGIGEGLCRELGRRGARVVVADINADDAGKSGEQAVSGLHCRAAPARRSAALTSARTATTAAAPASVRPRREGTMTDHKTGPREELLAARLNLAGQRVVVVGGTSGMGAATVRAARELGADVVSAGRRSRPSASPPTACARWSLTPPTNGPCGPSSSRPANWIICSSPHRPASPAGCWTRTSRRRGASWMASSSEAGRVPAMPPLACDLAGPSLSSPAVRWSARAPAC